MPNRESRYYAQRYFSDGTLRFPFLRYVLHVNLRCSLSLCLSLFTSLMMGSSPLVYPL